MWEINRGNMYEIKEAVLVAITGQTTYSVLLNSVIANEIYASYIKLET